jgi:hypothetical protein
MHFLYGIYLHLTKNKNEAEKYFLNVLDIQDLPSSALSSLYLISKNKKFIDDLLYFEKKRIYQDLVLYYRCLNDKKRKAHFINLLKNL